MGNKIVSLELSFACPEDWNKMKEQGDGRFCSKCSRTVKDFRTTTNEDFEKKIKQSQGSVCGHFNKSQVNPSFLKYAAAALITTLNACSSESVTPVTEQQQSIENNVELDVHVGLTGIVFDLPPDEDSLHIKELYQPPIFEIDVETSKEKLKE